MGVVTHIDISDCTALLSLGNQRWQPFTLILPSMYCYWHADIHAVNERHRKGGEEENAGATVGGVIAALIVVALVVVLVITGLCWWRSECAYRHVCT